MNPISEERTPSPNQTPSGLSQQRESFLPPESTASLSGQDLAVLGLIIVGICILLAIVLVQGMGLWIPLLVIGTSIWVYLDATKIGVRRTGQTAPPGRLHLDLNPFGWLVCSLLLWIVSFP